MTRAVVLRSKPKIADVREWCVALGILTAGNMTRAEAEMKLRAYVPLLQDEFPAAAFSQDSLAAVAKQCRWFPSYGELAGFLSAWWREHRPAPRELPPPPPPEPRAPPTPEEVAHVEACVAQCVAMLRAATLAVEAADNRLDEAVAHVRARHLTPEQLDRLNPLPGGRKRVQPPTTKATDDRHDLPADDQAPAGG